MNEVSINEGVGFIISNWWWCIPALLSIAFNVLGLLSVLSGILYCYINRQETLPWSYMSKVVELSIGKKLKVDSDGDYNLSGYKVRFPLH